MPAILKRREILILGHKRVVFSRLADGERCIPFLYIVARGPRNLPRDVWHAYLPFSLCLFISIYVLVWQIDKRGKDSVGPWERGWNGLGYACARCSASGKLHKDYTVYEDVKSILPIYIHVYPVRPCRDDLCEIIPSIWGAVARYDRSDLFIIACGQSHLFMNMLWSAMISCELTYHVATVLLVSCGGVFPHKNLVLSLGSKGYRHNTCI